LKEGRTDNYMHTQKNLWQYANSANFTGQTSMDLGHVLSKVGISHRKTAQEISFGTRRYTVATAK